MDKSQTYDPPATPTGLYWSERGAVCCADHIPFPGSDTWRWERWAHLAVHDAEAWRDQVGELPRCECCGQEAALPPF